MRHLCLGMRNVAPTPIAPVPAPAPAAAAAGGPIAGGSGEGAGNYTRPAIGNQTTGKEISCLCTIYNRT